MIQKVGINFETENKKHLTQSKKIDSRSNSAMQNTIDSKSIDSKLLQKYYVSFGATSKKSSRQIELEKNYTQSNKDLIKRAEQIAQKYGHNELNELHFQTAALESFRDYMTDLDSGVRTYDTGSGSRVVDFFCDIATSKLLKEEDERAKIKPVVNDEIKSLHKTLNGMAKKTVKSTNKSGLPIAEKIIDGAYDIFTQDLCDAESNKVPVEESMFLNPIYNSNEALDKNRFRNLCMRIANSVMIDSRPESEKIPVSAYYDKSKNVFKNLSLGTSMFVTYDKDTNPMLFVDSFLNLYKAQDASLGSLLKEDPKITVYNENLQSDLLLDSIRKAVKEKDQKHIYIFDMSSLLRNASHRDLDDDVTMLKSSFDEPLLNFFKRPPKNVQFVVTQDRTSYLQGMSDVDMQRIFSNFGEISMPVLSTEQTKKLFKEQPNLLSKIDTPFTKQAVDSGIDAAAVLDGHYPEKAQVVLKKIASYYAGRKEITAADVKKYVEEAKDIFKPNEDSNSIEIVFDTKIRLKDILGKDATKKEAESLVRQIKQHHLGSKGAIIYSQDGSVGSGRKYTAKAIAGETKSPYVEINALDFGTKDVDLFGDSLLSPEKSVTKLFSQIATQAESSPSKSAVLFIENFEYFSLGELISEYHQKAMAQLLREMDKATKKGLNVLVLGSVNNPNALGENVLKSFKFIDMIEVESPSRNIDARKAILSHSIKKNGIKLAGETEAQKESLVKLMAEITEHFPFVYLMNLTDKMKTVAFERNHKKAQEEDIVEAYLQLTTGRPASGPISEHRKAIVTAHECGHGFNEEFMYRLAKKSNIPWHLGEKVSFITLDPRGVFGGAMFSKDGGNEEYSFEKLFADLVCDFGGHSAEKNFYNINGSWGITADMEMATSQAEQAVGIMGQGHNFGKKSIAGMSMTLSEASKRVFEKDRDTILKNAELVSDLITKFSTTFNESFTNTYAKFVGTGKCLVSGDKYRSEIENWLVNSPKEKLSELEELDKTILNIIDSTKNGKVFDINAKSVSPIIQKLFKSTFYRF